MHRGKTADPIALCFETSDREHRGELAEIGAAGIVGKLSLAPLVEGAGLRTGIETVMSRGH